MIEIKRVKIKNIDKDTVKEVVKIFNCAFSTNRASILREENSWLWRYIERPSSEEDSLILAEVDKKIVGTVIVTFRNLKIGEKILKFGMIDDVATLPEYRRRGIARKMLEEAVEFVEEKNCDASALSADPEGNAKRIYESFGYKDTYYIQNFILPGHPYEIFKRIPVFTPLLPLWYIWSAIIKRKKYSKTNLKIEKLVRDRIKEYEEAINKFYSDFPVFSEEYLVWKHFKSPHKNILLVATEMDKITGAISLIVQRCRLSNYKIDVGYINEIFFEKEEEGYQLLYKIIEFAEKEKISVIQYAISFNNKKLFSFFKKIPAIKIGRGVFMVKDILSDCSSYFKNFNYVLNEHTVGLP